MTSLRHFQGVDLGFRGHVKCAEKKFTLFYLSCYVCTYAIWKQLLLNNLLILKLYRPGQADVQFLLFTKWKLQISLPRSVLCRHFWSDGRQLCTIVERTFSKNVAAIYGILASRILLQFTSLSICHFFQFVVFPKKWMCAVFSCLNLYTIFQLFVYHFSKSPLALKTIFPFLLAM